MPPEYEDIVEDLRKLTRDNQNPNRMTPSKKERVWKSLCSFGWVYPIVTNKDGLLADGEQRVDVCLEHKEYYGPVLRLPVEDIDRRLLRQILNKLRGEHDLIADVHEFERIKLAGSSERLKELLGFTRERLENYLELLHEPKYSDEDFKEALSRQESNVLDAEWERQHPKEPLTLTCNIEFATTAEVTDRTVAVCEAFGLGVDEQKHFPIFTDFKLEFFRNDIILITGDSGGGKSLLLEAFAKFFGDEAFNISDVEISPEETLIESVGEDIDEAIKFLSMCGLNDAFLFLRRYKELSEGQKYRYKLAKLINNKHARVWVIDEFCATLDRTTAKVVAYLIQKIARKLGITVVAVTAHNDLLEDFKPDIHIEKGFGDKVTVTKDMKFKKEPSLFSKIVLEKGTMEDYKELRYFHYLSHTVASPRDIYRLTLDREVIGVIIYAYTFRQLHFRNKIFKERYNVGPYDYAKQKLLNEEVGRIARVVIHPKFRGIGLGAYLIRESMPLTQLKVIETLAAMAIYNPCFEHAGMVKVTGTKPLDKGIEALKKILDKHDFNYMLMRSKKYCTRFYQSLPEMAKNKIMRLLADRQRHPDVRLSGSGDRRAKISDLTEFIPSETVYLYWINRKLIST